MKKKTAKKSQPKVQKKGFTLIEILVVSTIIIVVGAIGLVSYSGAQVSARDAQRKQDLENVRTTLLLYRSDKGYYPVAGLGLDSRFAFSFPRQVITRLGAAFRVSQVNAVVSPGDEGSEEFGFAQDTGTPADDSKTGDDTEKATPTPTPFIEPAETPSPAPTIVPGTGTIPAEALAYQEMAAILVEEGYLESDELPYDPVNDSTYYYGYDSDGSSFSLTARLEKDGSVVTLTD